MSEVKFFSLPNLATDEVTVVERPWEIKIPEEILALPKEEYKKRWTNPETRHHLLLMAEAQNKDYCVSVGNQAAVLYGFAADYDGILTDDLIESVQKKPQSRYCPAWWSKSQSGKLHLFWFFERPIAVAGNAHANQLLRIVAKKVKAAKWAVGYDPSCENVTQVMDIGYDWHVFRENAFIPSEELVLWDFAIFEAGAKGVSQDVVSIPFEVVADEVKKRTWAHKAPVDFRIGTRCIRFWDPTADNTSAAQVTKDGIRVYTPHDNGFKSWRSLLGAEFCEQYTARSMAPFIEDTYYCHTKDQYYRFFRNPKEGDKQHYEQRTEKMLRRELIIDGKLSDKVPKGAETSEVTNMLDAIVKRNSVDAVAPILYRKSGRIYVDEIGGTVLNTSLVVVKPPASRLASVSPEDLAKYPDCPERYKKDPGTCAWDNPFAVQGFPHIHRLITCFFMKSQRHWNDWRDNGFSLHDSNGQPRPYLCDQQLMCLVSWMAHFFVNAARMPKHPGRGQALILAGAAGVGKSFFARQILGQLMGGAIDAEKFYLEGSRFNSGIVTSPVHLIDDKLGAKSQRTRLQFTEALKIVVANGVLRYEAKFGSALETVPWPGRVVILSNEDAQSMSVMPDLDMSTRDKFMMLKLGGAKYDWGTDAENQKWLGEELPYLARFLLGWQIPSEMRDERFGVRAIQHSDMAQASAENGLTQVLVEVLETCIESQTGARDEAELSDAKGWAVQGNAVKIFKWIKSVDDALAREVIDSRTLQQCLQTLYKNGGYNITYDGKRWSIPYVLRKSENHG